MADQPPPVQFPRVVWCQHRYPHLVQPLIDRLKATTIKVQLTTTVEEALEAVSKPVPPVLCIVTTEAELVDKLAEQQAPKVQQAELKVQQAMEAEDYPLVAEFKEQLKLLLDPPPVLLCSREVLQSPAQQAAYEAMAGVTVLQGTRDMMMLEAEQEVLSVFLLWSTKVPTKVALF